MTDKMAERYEGTFLDALDLPEGAEVQVTIEAIVEPGAEKDSAGKLIKSAIISFVGKRKRLILNKTNWKNLKAMFGPKSIDWVGQQIKLQRRYLDAAHGFGINNTLAIRIIPPKGTPILKSAANFMGSPAPYGDVPKLPPKVALTPAPEPTAPKFSLADWLNGIRILTSPTACEEYRAKILPDCPEAIRGEVEQALVAHHGEILNQKAP